MTIPERYDVIIIGTGAGGGTLAYHLARAGKRILVLERGPFLPREKANWDTGAVFLENRYHTGEVWTDSEGRDLHPGTGYWVGGNTKVYGAALFRLRKEDFGVLRHKGGISPAWPLPYEAFEPYYTQAEKLYCVHGKQGLDPTEPPRSEEYPHPPLPNEPRMQEVEDDLRKLGLRPFPCPLGLQRDEADPTSSRCIRCDTCDGYPCLVHAKSDADVNCIREIMHLPNVTLRTRARATRLVTNATGTAVDSVEVDIGGEGGEGGGKTAFRDLPDPENRVQIVDGPVRLSYTPNNVESFERLRDRWIAVLKQAGHAEHWFHLRSYFKKRIPLEGVGHQNGTCRFGSDPRQSVLDVHCRTHDIDNLYVVDGSFFASSGAVNPSLTIMANALRVGDHLLERLR